MPAQDRSPGDTVALVDGRPAALTEAADRHPRTLGEARLPVDQLPRHVLDSLRRAFAEARAAGLGASEVADLLALWELDDIARQVRGEGLQVSHHDTETD